MVVITVNIWRKVNFSCIFSKSSEITSLVVSHFAMLDVMRRLVEAENALLGLVKVSEQFLVFLLLRHPMTVVTLLAPFPAKIGGISHCGLDQAMMNKPLAYVPRLLSRGLARLDFERTLGLLSIAHEVREELRLLQQKLEPLLCAGSLCTACLIRPGRGIWSRSWAR